MYITPWRNLRNKQDYVTTAMGDGLNTFNPPFEILDSQATDIQNLVSTSYPALTVRNGKTSKESMKLTTPYAIGQRANSIIHVYDGSTWKYWDTATSAYITVASIISVTVGGTFKEFSTGTTRYTIFATASIPNGVYSWDGTTVTFLSNAPRSNIFTTHQGRVYFCRDNDIVFSALNLINDYTTINDAGSIDVTNAKGVLTGIIEYNDMITAFTNYSMHILLGTGPLNYDLKDIEGNIGCVSNLSLAKCNHRLYWMWYDGVYEFDGTVPVKVSEPYGLNGVTGGITSFIKGINPLYLSLIVSESFGDYLYISVPYGSSTVNNLTFIFDTKLRKWYKRSDGFVRFTVVANVLYGIGASGIIWNLTDVSTQEVITNIDTTLTVNDISWYMITKAFTPGSPSAKITISNLWLIYKLPIGSTMRVAYSTSITGSFVDFDDIFTANANEQVQRMILPVSSLQNADWYRLKFYGTGPVTIYYLEKKGRIKYSSN